MGSRMMGSGGLYARCDYSLTQTATAKNIQKAQIFDSEILSTEVLMKLLKAKNFL